MAGRRRVLAREWLLALVEIAFDFGRVAGTALGDGPGAAHAGVQLIAGLEGEHHVLGPFGEPHAATSLAAPGVHRDGGGLVAFVDGGGPEHGAVRGFIYRVDGLFCHDAFEHDRGLWRICSGRGEVAAACIDVARGQPGHGSHAEDGGDGFHGALHR